jgi:hypothetical protein
MRCCLTRGGWAADTVVMWLVALGVGVYLSIGVAQSRHILSSLVCFRLVALSSTNIVSFPLLPLSFRLAYLWRYVSGDHERFTI